MRQLVAGHYCRLQVTSRELYCRYRRPLQRIMLVRNAGDRSWDTCKNIDVKGLYCWRDGSQFKEHRCLSWSFCKEQNRLARLKRGVWPGSVKLRPSCEDREKVTVTARGIILHPAKRHARVTPDVQGGTYSSEHMARRASGAPVVAARSWHVRARGRDWRVDCSFRRLSRAPMYEDRLPAGFVADFRGPPVNWE